MSQNAVPEADTEVVQNSERSRFEIQVGGRRAGIAAYRDLLEPGDGGEQRVFYHTEVDQEFEGQGLAAILVRQALDATREEGKRIVAVCPYVKVFVRRNHDWDECLDQPTDEIIGALSHG